GGYLDVRSIDAQVEVLNREFASTGIQFVRQTYQYWRNKEWFEGVDLDPSTLYANELDVAMKEALHHDNGPGELNIYSVGSPVKNASRATGWARYPTDYTSDPAGDGIVVRHWTFPETGIPSEFGDGTIMVHEMGHSLGLPHTFNKIEGCDPADGDGVADTPVEASAAALDPTSRAGRNSCPSQPGLDPIYN
ncbi:hypothetical protein BDY24DRAFT_331467, partial [Mrakia frigida]|uniref:uncharacterized protein n=1 Tax=Mrakia frigida TaxID=29902 RepID=UPI003FCC073F